MSGGAMVSGILLFGFFLLLGYGVWKIKNFFVQGIAAIVLMGLVGVSVNSWVEANAPGPTPRHYGTYP
ncbi:hypothetical protein M2163_001575 [Streptomyces sp. SAI-135]|jgi:hypothetical protein|uniref:hypothetical protein n=1 Tax=unclassified Streptomyces TaxID=2593676 RepID=UPI002474C276|nr:MULTISPECIES: hypothetical protein [unclassified Streptomyces]MDH6521436.1 hypothetical protein [Streptomyces sp. SAI-090]MDH6614467.1 hypothetical protein [Streptomyces sp. SAI-135]